MIGAGAKILGNIEVGEGAKIGSCSVVLQAVPPHTTWLACLQKSSDVQKRINPLSIWIKALTASRKALSMEMVFNRQQTFLTTTW